MKVKLQLYVFMLLIQASRAVWKHITLMKGMTLDLHCPIKGHSQEDHVQWRNPDGNVMFFDKSQGVKDSRYSFKKLTTSEYNIRVSDVTFSDGGNYTCSHYLTHTEDKTVEVIVLGRPHIELMETRGGKAVVKCTAEANYPPPTISWQFRNGPVFQFPSQTKIIKEGKKFETIQTLSVTAGKATLVKCNVHHPALHSKTLTAFYKIRLNKKNKHPRTTAPSLKTTRELTTDLFTTTEKNNSGFSTTAQFSTSDAIDSAITTISPLISSQSNTDTVDSATTSFPSTTLQSNTSVFLESTTNNQTSSVLNSTDLTTNIPINETNKNSTENAYDVEKQLRNQGNASLLVFLVTCLILGLLVVVIFIAIKLRKAHIAWKRENDDSDTSESSSKSKSSQEDKNGQRRRGFFNTGITHYVVQEPEITCVSNPSAMIPPEDTDQNTEQTSPSQVAPQTTARTNVKETEL